MSARTTVSIVTYNSAQHLQRCLRSLEHQTRRDFSILLWDNASTDGSAEIAGRNRELLEQLRISRVNVGFSAAHNQIIASTSSEYVLVLNPDVVLDPHFIERLVQALDRDPGSGSATGKLWRWPGEEAKPGPTLTSGHAATGIQGRILDSTGIYFTTNQRHLDRGSGEHDRGQYDTREYVFGPSGAAAFYRRKMLDDIKTGDEYFDEDFFVYREDADVAWRAQWLGWRCLYVPEARAFHVRRVLPERRPLLPRDINMHSFKNRFLLRVKNMDAGTYLRFLLPITCRDLLALGYVLSREHYSLRAIPLLLDALPRARSKRRSLISRRRVSPREMRAWFSRRPVARPVPVGAVPGKTT